MNHTQRIVCVARQRRSLTKALVREAVERYLEALEEDIASGERVDIPGIGKVQVSREEGKGYVTAIMADGTHQRPRLRTKIRLYEKFKFRCRHADTTMFRNRPLGLKLAFEAAYTVRKPKYPDGYAASHLITPFPEIMFNHAANSSAFKPQILK